MADKQSVERTSLWNTEVKVHHVEIVVSILAINSLQQQQFCFIRKEIKWFSQTSLVPRIVFIWNFCCISLANVQVFYIFNRNIRNFMRKKMPVYIWWSKKIMYRAWDTVVLMGFSPAKCCHTPLSVKCLCETTYSQNSIFTLFKLKWHRSYSEKSHSWAQLWILAFIFFMYYLHFFCIYNFEDHV